MFYRVINQNKWPEFDNANELKINDIPAGPISTDMRADKNDFSIWEFSDNEIDDGILALIVNKNKINIEKITVVKIRKEKLDSEHFIYEQSVGDTLFYNYKEKHYDIKNLNHAKLGCLAKLIIKSIDNEEIQSFSKKKLIDQLIEKLNKHLILFDDLNEKLKAQMVKEINKRINSKKILIDDLNDDIKENLMLS